MSNALNLVPATFLELRLSGGAANSNTRLALGGAMSFYAPTSEVGGNLFPDVTAAQLTSGLVSYRCFYLANTRLTAAMNNLTTWLQTLPGSASTTMAIGADPAGVGGAATTIATETTAPTGVTFSAPTTYAGGINLGNIPAGSFAAVWVRRTITAAAAVRAYDRLLLGLQFD